MFDLYDETGKYLRTVRSGRNLKAPTGKTFSDAALAPLSDLNSAGVYPVKDPGIPDQTWQSVTGTSRILQDGKSVWSYRMEPISLDEAKRRLKADVKTARDAVMSGGYVWMRDDGTEISVQTDEKSQARLSAAYAMARNGHVPAEGIVWRLADNSTAVLSATEIMGLAAAVGNFVMNAYAVQASKEAEIDVLPDLDTAKAYDPRIGFAFSRAQEPEVASFTRKLTRMLSLN